MQDGKTLLDKAQQQLTSSASTPIPAGQKASSDKSAVIDAINQMFAEFQIVYHNQFTKAFPTEDKVKYAKQLWFANLQDYSAKQIIAATHDAIKHSEFLPTVRGILKYCENDYEHYGLPEPRAAYIEACNAASPKANANWSHPAVYHAGIASDWFFLANNSEARGFPVFEKHYEKICTRVRQGETLAAPQTKALEQKPHIELSQQEQLKKVAEIKEALKK